MFLVLMLFWVIFNGKVTLEILLVGAAVSAVLTYAWRRIFKISRNTVLPSPEMVWRYMRYFGNLVIEIVRCNFLVMRLILHPGEEVHPGLVTFKIPLKKDNHKVILANSVTLTPGTITVGLQGDTMRVHGLDMSFLEGIETCDMVEKLAKMEEDSAHE